jgi:DNA repair protein SbcC/Rad50
MTRLGICWIYSRVLTFRAASQVKHVIIRSMTLHNFMSYADARIDLSSVSVACMSGHNGSGKSALLDAITWALWEEGRSSSDELIRLGEKEMWVDLIFDYEDRTYRVRRSRQRRASKGGARAASKGTLDLQLLAPIAEGARSHKDNDSNRDRQTVGAGVAVSGLETGSGATIAPALTVNGLVIPPTTNQESGITSHPSFDGHSDGGSDQLGHWRSLTAASMRETQQVICNLLRMDYDTFVNSAYLRQGRADEFTTRLPSERKQILSEILGLAYFDRLQEACRLKARDSKTRMEIIETNLLSLPELERESEELMLLLEQQSSELKLREDEVKLIDDSVIALVQTVQQLKLMCQRALHGEAQLVDLKRDVANYLIQRNELQRRQASLSQLINRSGEIKLKSEEFDRVKAEIEKLDQKSLIAQTFLEEKMRLQSQLASIRSRLEVELDHYKQSAADCQKKCDALRYDIRDGDKTQAAHDEFKKLLKEEAELAQKQDTFTRLTERASQLHASVTECKIKLEAEIGQKELTLTELEQVIAAELIVAEQKLALEKDVGELEKVECEFELIEEKGMLLKSELESIEVKVAELRRRQVENKEKARELTEHRHESICPLCAAPIVDRSAVIQRYQTANDSLESEIMFLFKTRDECEDERKELRTKYAQLKRELSRRKELDNRIGQFNEKSATIERARESRSKVASEIMLLGRRLDDMDFAVIERESLINVKAEIHKLEFDPAHYANLQSQIRSRRHVESRYLQLKKDQAELEKLEIDLPVAIEKHKRASEELASESYGEDLREALKYLKGKLEELQYDKDEHQALKLQMVELMPFVDQVRDLRKAMNELPAVEESLGHVVRMLTEKEAKIPEIESEIAELQHVTVDLNEQQIYLADKQELLASLRARYQVLARDVAVTQSRKEQIDKELEILKEKKNELQILAEEREDHLFLAEAFGKKGIQAVIIENAVPEIEDEANRILARLSENKMHVALVTQHKTRSGSIAETLDIVIGDEIGTRNYELYSGGEAFKVNFAIRIALSRLLARRAGARLETLIIDEGFGSQDELSRERLVRAIKSIQTDFRKILVITHIQEVQEMFPVQILVKKESGVSRLQVVS